MSQPPLDAAMQALAGFWVQAGKAAQEAAGPPLAALLAMSAASPSPDLPPDAGLAQAAKAVADLWAAAASMSAALGAMMGVGGKGLDPTVEAAVRAISDPPACAAMGGIASLVPLLEEGAQLADAGAGQQARLVQAWLDLRRCALEHDAVMLDAWLRAGAAFNEAAARAKAEGRPVEGQAALALWATAGNAVLMEAQRAEAFLQSQAAVFRAGSEVRLAQRGLAEHWAGQCGLPTRTEMDEVHQAVTELRREVRALQRQARAGAAPQP